MIPYALQDLEAIWIPGCLVCAGIRMVGEAYFTRFKVARQRSDMRSKVSASPSGACLPHIALRGALDRIAKGAGTRIIRSAVRAPLINSICEPFLGSVRRESLDHIVILGERHLQTVLEEYCFDYFNGARPHQGLSQHVPVPGNASVACHNANQRRFTRRHAPSPEMRTAGENFAGRVVGCAGRI